MKKIEALKLFRVLSAITSSSLEKEDKIKLILLRIKLRNIAEEYDQLVEEFKNVNSETDMDVPFPDVVTSWGNGLLDIDSNVLSQYAVVSMLQENNLVGVDEDILFTYLIKRK